MLQDTDNVPLTITEKYIKMKHLAKATNNSFPNSGEFIIDLPVSTLRILS